MNSKCKCNRNSALFFFFKFVINFECDTVSTSPEIIEKKKNVQTEKKRKSFIIQSLIINFIKRDRET